MKRGTVMVLHVALILSYLGSSHATLDRILPRMLHTSDIETIRHIEKHGANSPFLLRRRHACPIKSYTVDPLHLDRYLPTQLDPTPHHFFSAVRCVILIADPGFAAGNTSPPILPI